MSYFFKSIGVRLLRYVFAFYLLIAILTTGFQIWAEYNQAKKDVFSDLIKLDGALRSSLREAIWSMDNKQIEILIQSISNIDFIEGIKIITPKGSVLTKAGKTSDIIRTPQDMSQNIIYEIPINNDLLFEHSYTLTFPLRNEQKQIASIYIYSGKSSVINRVKYGIGLLMISAVFKTLALWMIFYVVIKKLLVEPIQSLENEVAALNPDNVQSLVQNSKLDTIISDNNGNELSKLGNSFNLMRKAIIDKISIIESHKISLEKEVTEKTQELLNANIELKKLALYDPLTGIANRRFFSETCDTTIKLAKRNNVGAAIVSIDLKRFKDINDRWGHQAGDAYLKEFSSRLEATRRESDVFARMGGDEFQLIMYGVDKESWEKTLAKFISSLQTPLFWAQHTIKISANFGVALFPHHSTENSKLLHYADQAMYAAKNSSKEYTLFSHDIDEMYRFEPKVIPE